MSLSLSSSLPKLALKDSYVAIIGLGVITHLVFKRFEPANLLIIVLLLLALPISLTCLLSPHFPLLLASLGAFTTFHTSLLTSILAYRLSPFHPLAKYPGPIQCKITMLWMVSVGRSGKRHMYLRQLHERYGDAVRIGPNEVSIRDASIINSLMGTTGLPKGPNWAGRSLHPDFPPLIIIRNPAEHLRRRKPWNRAFSTASLKGYEPVIEKRVRQLVDALADHKDQVVDLAKWISFFTFDFMGDMAFGGGYELMREGDKHGLWRVVEDGMSLAITFEHVPWLARLIRGMPGVGEDTKQMRALGIQRAKVRMESGSTTKDLFYYLSNEDGVEKQSPSRAQIISDGSLAMIAGSDTTASALSNIFFLLAANPPVCKRLQDEVDRFYPHGEDALSTKHHANMPYLEAVINEALRLWPIILSGSQRSPPPGSGGVALGPYFIPEGNQARVHYYSVQRDPRNFSPSPDSFWPERWLIAEGLQSFSSLPEAQTYQGEFIHNSTAFVPFSHGPYNCVGKNLAMLEMKMLLCHTVQQLEFSIDEKWDVNEWEKEMYDFFVMKKGKLPVVVSLRHS